MNIMVQQDEKRVKVSVEEDFTVLNLKEHAEREWKIPVKFQKVIFMGQVLEDRDTIVNANRHNIKNPVFSVCKTTSPHRGRGEEGEKMGEGTWVQNLAGKKLRMCYILLANIKAGNDAYEERLSPEERERVDEPVGMEVENVKKPTVKELGVFHRKMAQELSRYNRNIMHTSDVLIDDPELIPEKAEYEEVRRKIQLTMDMARYIAPLMKINGGFIIPLRQKPQRFLAYRENPLA